MGPGVQSTQKLSGDPGCLGVPCPTSKERRLRRLPATRHSAHRKQILINPSRNAGWVPIGRLTTIWRDAVGLSATRCAERPVGIALGHEEGYQHHATVRDQGKGCLQAGIAKERAAGNGTKAASGG